MKAVKFDKSHSKEFVTDLRQAVETYFKENNISRYGNANMVFKSIVMLSLFFVPYGFIVSGTIVNPWALWSLWLVMGVGLAGIGLSIMHDGNHGAYSKYKWVNRLMGLTLNMVGGSAKNWKIQHNRMHHTYTNVHEMDPDISPLPILRFSPKAPYYSFHKYQYIYAWFFYGLLSFSWATVKEFIQLGQFKRNGLIKGKEYPMLMAEMVFWKIVYYAYLLVIPMTVLDISFGFWFLCFFSMHFVAGLILATIFQTAHVMPECDYPTPNEEGTIENSWAIHQLQTTSNYNSNRFFSWYVGGLNYQVEHHLFPTICHVHYRDLSKIVKQKAKEHNLPYYAQDNYFKAVWEHGKMLHQLGKKAA
jgi:linoleoyl-CoA desaturase